MTQEKLREAYGEVLIREKQKYIAQKLNIDGSILSKFRHGILNLSVENAGKLEAYLTHNH